MLLSRKIAFVLFAGFALVAAGCGSNNKGKIEGRWKMTSIPGMDPNQQKMLEALKMYVYMEFKPDGTMTIGAASSDPTMQEALGKSKDMKTVSCKYKLLSGDGVEFYDLPKEMQEDGPGGGLFGKKDRARTKVKITGDSMTMTDNDGKTLSLTKVQ